MRPFRAEPSLRFRCWEKALSSTGPCLESLLAPAWVGGDQRESNDMDDDEGAVDPSWMIGRTILSHSFPVEKASFLL